MTDDELLSLVESEDSAMLTCPYYQLSKKCDLGCWTEPRCQVNEPLEGWQWRDLKGRFSKRPDKETLKAIAAARSKAEDLRHPPIEFS